MEKTIAPNPFTPKSGWEPKVFVGREKEIEIFKKKLEEAKKGRCDHFIILGDWGIGKTSLLKEFKKIAQKNNLLASQITISEYTENNTFNDGVKELIEEIPQKLPIDINKLKSFMKQLNSLGVQFLGAGFTFSRIIKEMQPQSLFFNFLKTLWQDLKKESEVVVILVDDVQNFAPIAGIFTILKNVLSDEEITKTKFLFVLSCTPDAWKGFLERYHPIGRYFTPRLNLERLDKEKTFALLNKILKGTGVAFDKVIKEKIYEYTQGHPYELQVLCSILYDNQIGSKVTKKVWSFSLKNTLKELGEKVFDGLYERASEQEKKILYILALKNKVLNWKEIADTTKKQFKNFPYKNVGEYLNRLVEKGLIKQIRRGIYTLPDRIFREYLVQIRRL